MHRRPYDAHLIVVHGRGGNFEDASWSIASGGTRPFEDFALTRNATNVRASTEHNNIGYTPETLLLVLAVF